MAVVLQVRPVPRTLGPRAHLVLNGVISHKKEGQARGTSCGRGEWAGLWSAHSRGSRREGLPLPHSHLLPEQVRPQPSALWGARAWAPEGLLAASLRGEEQNLHTLVLLPQ